MIIGGVSGAGKTSSLRSGYSQRFLPCMANIKNSAIVSVINQTTRQVIEYFATVRIRNVANTEWVTLGTATYFQITKSSNGGYNTAQLTVAQAETWSAYKSGTEYAYLLSPSGRACQVLSGIKINGIEYQVPVFYGRIDTYYESIGGKSSSISLSLTDIRKQLQKKTSVFYLSTSYVQTRYRAIIRELKAFIASGGVTSSALKMLMFMADSELSSADVSTGTTLDSIEAILQSMQRTLLDGSGSCFFGVQDSDNTNYAFEYNDDNIISLTSKVEDADTFNSVRIIYSVGGVRTYATITDAADVLLRGNVYYPSLVGGSTLAYATRLANDLISFSLFRDIRLEVLYNPYIEPGQIVKISSTRNGIPASHGIVTSVVHQYRVGRAITYLNGLRITAI